MCISKKFENKRSLKEELILLINYIRTVPRYKFDAADLADSIIRKYFKELEE